jgi:acetyl esterase/lipase
MIDDRNDSVSAHEFTGVGIWDRNANMAGWNAYLGDSRGSDDVSVYAAPIRATNLAGLPPAYIDVGSTETFRDEDVQYAQNMWSDGTQCELHVWPGAYHGFEGLCPGAQLSIMARKARLDWLRRILFC